MEQLNASDSMIKDEVYVQMVFPLLNTHRFVCASTSYRLIDVVHEVKKLDEFLRETLDLDHPWIFDASGTLLNPDSCLKEVNEAVWVQLFVI